MKKFGRACTSILPMLAFLFIQLLVAWAAMFVFMVIVMVQNGGQSGQEQLMDGIMQMYNNNSGTVIFLFEIVSIFVFGLWYGLVYVRKSGRINPLRIVSARSIGGLLCAVAGMFLLTQGFMVTIAYLFPAWMESYNDYIESSGIVEGMFAMCAVLFLAPIAEELVFRGITLRLLKWAGVGTAGVIIIQALFFGLMHMVPLQICYTFLVGLVLGYLAVKYDSIYITIAGHMLFNFSGTIITSLLGMLGIPDWIFIPLSAVGVLGVVGMVLLVKGDAKAVSLGGAAQKAEVL